MSRAYPYAPPADAKEWICPVCRCDVLWCGCTQLANPIPHGLTCGKRYRFRADCDECIVEAWERMTEGGIQVQPKAELSWISDARIHIPYKLRLMR